MSEFYYKGIRIVPLDDQRIVFARRAYRTSFEFYVLLDLGDHSETVVLTNSSYLFRPTKPGANVLLRLIKALHELVPNLVTQKDVDAASLAAKEQDRRNRYASILADAKEIGVKIGKLPSPRKAKAKKPKRLPPKALKPWKAKKRSARR